MTKNLPDFESNDVISFQGFTIRICDFQQALEKTAESTYFSRQFHDALTNQQVRIDSQYRDRWDEGIDCEALKLSDPSWRPGKLKLRLCLDFIPEEPALSPETITSETPESPLDEIRNMLSDS